MVNYISGPAAGQNCSIISSNTILGKICRAIFRWRSTIRSPFPLLAGHSGGKIPFPKQRCSDYDSEEIKLSYVVEFRYNIPYCLSATQISVHLVPVQDFFDPSCRLIIGVA